MKPRSDHLYCTGYGNFSKETIKKNPVIHAVWEAIKTKGDPEKISVPKKDYDALNRELKRKDELIASGASLQMQLINMQRELDKAHRDSKSKDERIAILLEQNRRLQEEKINLRNGLSPFAS